MDKRLYDLHLQAGRLSGQEKTCGKKTPYASEALAQKAAEAHNRWEERKHDVEPYPCAFCHQWHIGGIMPLPLLEAMAASSINPAEHQHQGTTATGSFKLAKQSGGIGLYAEVFVEISQDTVPSSVSISPDAFAWLKNEYGPDAWEWPVCDEYRAGAISGCEHALRHTSQGQSNGIHVLVTRIHAHPAHSTWDSVAYASCFAVWDALKDEGIDHPQLVAGKIQNIESLAPGTNNNRT